MFFYNLHKKKTIFIHRRARSLQMLLTVHTVYGENKKVLPLAGIMRKRARAYRRTVFELAEALRTEGLRYSKSDV